MGGRWVRPVALAAVLGTVAAMPACVGPQGDGGGQAAATPAARLTATASAAPSADVTPSAGTAPAPTLPERELTGSGAWSWFGDPRAVYHEGEHRRTYVGWIDERGTIEVSSHDHDTGRRTVGELDSDFQIDDHNNPSIIVRPDGHLLAFWSAHNGSAMYYRRSSAPEDVTSWGPTRTLGTNTRGADGYTYPNVVQLSAEDDRIYLFWRGGDLYPAVSTSDDDGTTWSPARRMIDSRHPRPYVKVGGNGTDTIAMAFTEGHPGFARTSISYAAYRDGAFYRADGSLIGTMDDLPLTPGDSERVYDARADDTDAWVHDVALDSAGHPVIVYATFPTETDHRYRYARWDGTRWRDVEIIDAGGSMSEDARQPNFSGGITLDHEDPSTVYLSRQVDGVFEIEQWRTPDGGASWTRTPITSGSERHNYRPITPRGRPGGAQDVIWMRGSYPSYTAYRTGLRMQGRAGR